MPRSGTTWIHDILGAHPQAVCVFESFLFGDAGLGGCASSLHWRPPAGGGAIGELVSREEVIQDLRALAGKWLAGALEPHHRFLIEKTPGHLYMIDFISEIFPEAKFIHVLRDGRDVAVSSQAAARGWASWWGSALVQTDLSSLSVRLQLPFGTLHSRARAWQRIVDDVRTYEARLGTRLLSIKYEDVHADADTSIRTLFDFCGMPYDAALVRHAHEANDFRQFTAGETHFRRGGRIGDWRQNFSLLDRVIFDRAAGRGLVEAGYERDRMWWCLGGRRARGPQGLAG